MFDIISIGDATLDTFIEIDKATLKCSINKDDCLFCLSYADKIPIYNLERRVAGNAANNAVGSSRLGMKAAFWTIIGEDKTGKLVQDTMKKEGVSNKFVQVDKGSESNYTVVLNYKGERTQLVHRKPRQYKLPKLDKTKWIYLTAMGKEHVLITKPLVEFIKKNNIQLGYNPGKEQLSCNIMGCIDLFKYTKILFVNKDEAKIILGKEKGDFKFLLKELFNLGPKIVVITDGANGSYCYDGQNYYQAGIYKAKLKEMTGAGDAFATGFVSAVFYGHDVKTAFKWGSANSASVITKIGPQDGLLTLKQIKQKTKKPLKIKQI